MSGADLRGALVLVPRAGTDDPIAVAVRGAGGRALPVALVRTVPAAAAHLDHALAAMAAGSWLAVTSATTVRVLAGRAAATGTTLARAAAGTRVAAVGPATAQALAREGLPVDLLPADSSAAGLLAAWPAGTGTVVLPHSALAAPTLADGLRRRGWTVEDVAVYTTVPAPGDDRAAAALAAGDVDAVLLTSGSSARALVELYGPPPTPTVVCAIGVPTAEAAARAGLVVAAVATEQTPEGLVDAAARALRARREAAAGPTAPHRPVSAPGPAPSRATSPAPAPEETR